MDMHVCAFIACMIQFLEFGLDIQHSFWYRMLHVLTEQQLQKDEDAGGVHHTLFIT